jgi:UDP-N-acetylmuramoylalanine--D-glutamate ligase
MKVAVIGYEIEGKSAVSYWLAKGAEVTVCKRTESPDIPEGVGTQYGEGYLQGLDQFDVINRTGSIHPDILLAANSGIGDKITTVIDEFFRVSPTKNIIGVTGTKGKGTTSTMIYKMLQAAGKHAFLAGNIGKSPLDFVDQLNQDSWVVLELSSYQLYDLRRSPRIGVCLTVVPEHLNWHGSMDDYIRSKQQLFAHQTEKDVAIYFADNQTSHDIASVSPGAKIPYFAVPGAIVEDDKYLTIDDQRICEVGEIALVGKHNWQNACAAITALWQVTHDVEALRSVLLTFSGLPHRIEFLREVDGIRYFNDSFAANVSATEAAVEAISGPKVLILGGFDRMIPLEDFARFIKSHEKELAGVLLIGQSAHRLGGEFEKAGFTDFTISSAQSMPEIVADARKLARSGESIVLSPGFPSFDMFKNFEVRGDQFRQEIQSL